MALCACSAVKNMERPVPPSGSAGFFYKTADNTRLFVYDYKPKGGYNSAIFIISGITGINHNAEEDIIEQLSNNENRVVVIHPRGTGYSEGTRGDISNFSDFITDYIEIITNDTDYHSKEHKILLFGHSMSSAILLAVADKLEDVGGAIIVNPPYILKKAKGMSPGFGEYVQYGWHYLFNRHKPIINMAGDPARIENEADRKDSEARANDPLLVQYFSLYVMTESRKVMNAMIDYCRKAKYPLLLIYGLEDNLVDKKGCDLIFKEWACADKQYALIENGSHGKSSVKLARDVINAWIKNSDKSGRAP